MDKATGSASVKGVSLTFNNSSRNLVTVSGNTGTMHYRVGTSGSWTTTIPTSTNVGSWTIYYYMDASTNYTARGSSSSPWGSVSSSIAKANISPTVSMSNWTYGQTASNPSVSGNTGGGSVSYSYKVSGASDSTYTSTKPSKIGTYTVRAIISATTNYNGATVTSNFSILKMVPTLTWSTTPPT